MNREELALSYKHARFNCCQAVLLAFEDKVSLDRETLISLSAPFGAGMGNMKGSCGALVAAQMLTGLLPEDGKPAFKSAREVINAFEEMCGATVCEEIKGVYTGYVRCSCDDCVRNAVKIIEERSPKEESAQP